MNGRGVLLWCALGCSACIESPDVVAIVGAGGEAGAPGLEAPEVVPISGALEVHDPSVAFDGESFWLFSTGSNLPIRTSRDLSTWEIAGDVFAVPPAWVTEQVPEAEGYWSPEWAYFGGLHHLYYAVSTFASGRSCIGHATSESLAGGGDWSDEGPVICSDLGDQDDDWNAIDPSVLVGEDEQAWLALGSYRSGIKLIRLEASGARADSSLVSLAARGDDGAIQAAELTERDGFYYLFVAFDACCQGADSTHKLMVGRSPTVEGPYMDRAAFPLLEGGGTLVLQGAERWRGPGSNDVFASGDRTYNFYHAYDAENDGRPTLRISTLVWDEAGWPISAGP